MATAPKITTDTSAAALSAALAAPQVEKDEFADAFAGFTDPKPEPVKTEPAAEVKDGKEAPAAGDDPGTEIVDPPAAGAEGEEGEKTPEQIEAEAAAAAAGEKTPEQIAAEAAAAAKPKPKDPAEDAISRLADVIAQRQTPPQPQQPQRVEPPPLYTNEEITQIQQFYKEWPEVAPAVETLLKGVMKATEDRIFAEVARVIGPKLKMLDQLADNAVYSQIKQAVPDYDETLEEKVSAWVKTQPSYLQTAYTNVMQNGTADDITDLVKRFRQETGTAATKQPDPAPKQAAQLSPAAKKAAAALAPVTSKRTGNTQVDPQSFDEAFEVFAKAG